VGGQSTDKGVKSSCVPSPFPHRSTEGTYGCVGDWMDSLYTRSPSKGMLDEVIPKILKRGELIMFDQQKMALAQEFLLHTSVVNII